MSCHTRTRRPELRRGCSPAVVGGNGNLCYLMGVIVKAGLRNEPSIIRSGSSRQLISASMASARHHSFIRLHVWKQHLFQSAPRPRPLSQVPRPLSQVAPRRLPTGGLIKTSFNLLFSSCWFYKVKPFFQVSRGTGSNGGSSSVYLLVIAMCFVAGNRCRFR